MQRTTVCIKKQTHEELQKIKCCQHESFDELLNRLIKQEKTEPITVGSEVKYVEKGRINET